TERSPLSRLLGIEMLEETADRAVARLEIRDEHKTPTGVVHSGTILSLADDCATRAANRANDEGPNPGAFMVLVDLHSAMLGNQAEGILTAVSTIVRCGRRITIVRAVVTGADEKRLAEITTTHIPA
ncbi:MAG: PaaI family thioesterase, partial [Pseudomonadota bacterium]|nr:PaaI family thioesterase [Pseudomonadota bacterium]